MRICVVFNPTARSDRARRFQERLADFAPGCALAPTDAPGAGRRLAARAVRDGFDTIVAAGGDGTVNEVLNGIADAPDGFARARLGVLPMGTVNVFAKEIRIPARLSSAWAVIEAGFETRIDVGEVEFDSDGRRVTRCFAQTAGAGVDARAIELVDLEQKRRFGPLAYVASALEAIREAKPRIEVRGAGLTLSAEQVIIGNGRFYGGRIPLFAGASLSDGLLDVAVLPRVTWPRLARGVCGLALGRLYTLGGVRHLRTATFELTSGSPVVLHVEGENVGHLPAKFAVRRGALRVVAPPA